MKNLLIAGIALAAVLLWLLSGRGAPEHDDLVDRAGNSPQVSSHAALDVVLDGPRERESATVREVAVDDVARQIDGAADAVPPGDSFLEVRVERDGAAAPGVRVWICDRRQWRPIDFLDVVGGVPGEAVSLVTEGAGVARFERIRRARYTVGLATTRPMERPTRYVAAELHAGHSYTVALGTATVRGTVHGADGETRAGAGVQVVGRRPDPLHKLIVFAHTTTDARGEYSIGDLAGTEYVVVMSPDGKFDGRDGPETQPVTLTVGETAVVDFGSALGAPRWRGRVLNTLGESFPGTGSLALTRIDDGTSVAADVHLDGHFEFAFTPGTWNVRARVTGAPGGGFDLGKVELLAEDTQSDLTIPGTRVTGILSPPDVIEETSRPHSWTGVSFRLEGHNYPAAIRTVNVDAAGRYTIDGLSPGKWIVEIWPGELVGDDPTAVIVNGGEARIELDLQKMP